jgi:hypothetical protein
MSGIRGICPFQGENDKVVGFLLVSSGVCTHEFWLFKGMVRRKIVAALLLTVYGNTHLFNTDRAQSHIRATTAPSGRFPGERT